MKQLSPLQEQLLSILPQGNENAKTAGELAKVLNLEKRTISELVHLLRCEGYPIIGSSSIPYGMYLAKTQIELNGFIKQETNRANSTNKMIQLLKTNLKKEYLKNV